MNFLLSICFVISIRCELLSVDETTFRSIDTGLIAFTAPWCPHCQRLEPHLQQLADEFEAEKLDVDIGIVDCTVHAAFCQSQKAIGYPTILFKRKEFTKKYTSRDRTATAIGAYIRRQIAPIVSMLNSSADYVTFRQRAGRICVVAVVRDATTPSGKQLYDVLANAASRLEDVLFAILTDPSHDASLQHVALLRTFDEPQLFYRDELDADKLRNFVFAHRKPILAKHTIIEYGLDEPLLFLHRIANATLDSEIVADKNAMEQVRNAAVQLRGKSIAFAWLDKYEWDGTRAGLSGQVYPAMTIDDIRHSNRRYKFDETKPLTTENVLKFVESFLDGSMQPFRYSQPLSLTENNDKEIVKTIVLANFNESLIERTKTKNVFVMFHSPTCSTSSALYAPFKELANEMQTYNIEFAMAHAWMNDFPDYLKLSGVPDLRLFRVGRDVARENLEFSGNDRSIPTMKSWLLKHIITVPKKDEL